MPKSGMSILAALAMGWISGSAGAAADLPGDVAAGGASAAGEHPAPAGRQHEY
jgi:hypothetical protein